MNPRKTVISIYIDPDIVREIDAIATLSSISRCRCITDAIHAYIQKYQIRSNAEQSLPTLKELFNDPDANALIKIERQARKIILP